MLYLSLFCELELLSVYTAEVHGAHSWRLPSPHDHSGRGGNRGMFSLQRLKHQP